MKKKPVALVIILVLIIANFASIAVLRDREYTPISTDNYFLVQGLPKVSAHRAGSLVAPENTMMAFEDCTSATDFEVDIFEFDLHITSDGVLVLLHDDELDRTSNAVEVFGTKHVLAGEHTYAELRRLNMGYNFQNENGEYPFRAYTEDTLPDNLRIVRLEVVLDYLLSVGDYDYVIEIKNGDEQGMRAADALYDILTARGIVNRVAFGTFQGEISQYVQENYPSMTRSAGIKEVLQFYFWYLYNIDLSDKELGYTVLQIPYKLGLNLGKKRLVDYAHRYGIAVQYWTINEAEDIEYLASIGADAIISDCPDVAYEIISEMEEGENA